MTDKDMIKKLFQAIVLACILSGFLLLMLESCLEYKPISQCLDVLFIPLKMMGLSFVLIIIFLAIRGYKEL